METGFATDTVIEAHDIQKSFGSVQVLRGVNLSVRTREIVGLVGDNGAGKSTLLKILSGVLACDSGEIRVAGRPVEIRTPDDAHGLGVETVYQDLALAPHLDVAANLFLGREIVRSGLLGKWGFMDKKAMQFACEEDLRLLGLRVRKNLSTAPVMSLSGGQQQAVAVARAITWGRRLLILDEPTAALGVRETKQVLDTVRRVREERDLSVLMVTHDLPSALRICDRVVVLRLGRDAATFDAGDVSIDRLVGTITGVYNAAGDRSPDLSDDES